MNIEEYISSGIIESYVLGLATEEERVEFEHLCNIYPALVTERGKFELALERRFIAAAKQPPEHVSHQLWERIHVSPVSPAEVIAMPAKKRAAGGKTLWYYATAACVIVLLGCAYFFYQLQLQNKQLTNANKQLLAKVGNTDSVLNSLVSAKKALKNDNLSMVQMTGARGAETSGANIYWDSASAAVYLVVKDLPPLPPGKQYQLWALIGNKPKDLGVFDASSNRVILKMKNCKKAQAFSITIEQNGGNTAPSPNSVQVTGKTNSL